MVVIFILSPIVLKGSEKHTSEIFLYFSNIDFYGILGLNKKLHHLILPLRFLFPYLLKQMTFPTLKPTFFSSPAVKD